MVSSDGAGDASMSEDGVDSRSPMSRDEEYKESKDDSWNEGGEGDEESDASMSKDDVDSRSPMSGDEEYKESEDDSWNEGGEGDECDSILSLRKYSEIAKHPWVFFVQWYRGKTYHMKHTPDPFDRPELYNVTTPCIKTAKYDITFFRHGAYVVCYDRIAETSESYFLYSEEREAAMDSLKTWVSTAEGTYGKGAKAAALSMSPIDEISDISKYDVDDEFPHMWALFLQFFVGAALDISTCARAVKPLECLFSDGIIYGSGYVIRIDDDNKVVHLDDTPYAIYGENAFETLDALKWRVLHADYINRLI